MPDRDRVPYRAIARRGLIAFFLVGAVALFVVVENLVAQSFQACVIQERSRQSANNANKERFIVGRGVEHQIVCSIRLLDAHNGFITALAGIAVALFTFALRNSTHLLWKAGREALETTERAFVFIDGFNAEITTAANDQVPDLANLPLRYRDMPDLFLTRFAVQPRWKNSGNTPTRRMTIRTHWRGPPGPVPPDYIYTHPFEPLFLAPKATEPSRFHEMNQAAQLIDWGLNPIGAAPMFFIWGRADYEDVFNKPHFVEWCYQVRFERHDGKTLRASFIQWGDYNRTDEDERT